MSKGSYLVLGAAGSIGRLVTRLLLDAGERVVAGVRDVEEAGQLSELEGARLEPYEAKDWASVERLVEAGKEEDEGIDGLAVCVGSILLKPAHLTTQAEFEEVVALNLSSCFAAVRAVARPMMKRGGSIVLVSSAAARHGFPNHEAIAAAKAGVIGLTLSAAASYASYGIRVNCVAPGLVPSKMSQGIVGNELSRKASEAMHAVGRIGEPEEVARAIVWLLSRDQTWVTGQTLGIDGGLATLFSKKR